MSFGDDTLDPSNRWEAERESEIESLKRDLKTVGDDLESITEERDKLRAALDEIAYEANKALRI